MNNSNNSIWSLCHINQLVKYIQIGYIIHERHESKHFEDNDRGGGTILKVGGPVLKKVDDQWW